MHVSKQENLNSMVVEQSKCFNVPVIATKIATYGLFSVRDKTVGCFTVHVPEQENLNCVVVEQSKLLLKWLLMVYFQ